jgi:hypothetical protein
LVVFGRNAARFIELMGLPPVRCGLYGYCVGVGSGRRPLSPFWTFNRQTLALILMASVYHVNLEASVPYAFLSVWPTVAGGGHRLIIAGLTLAGVPFLAGICSPLALVDFDDGLSPRGDYAGGEWAGGGAGVSARPAGFADH